MEMGKKTLLDSRQRILDMNRNLGLEIPESTVDPVHQVCMRLVCPVYQASSQRRPQDFNEMATVCNDQINMMIPHLTSSHS